MKPFLSFVLLALTIFIGACSKKDSTPAPLPNPVFSVKLVDAPSVYDAVNVEILGIEVNTGTGWIPLALDEKGVFNLLQFTNGSSLPLMNDTVMSPCTISELRMILGTNNTVVIGGVSYELKTPSGQSSGYKVKMDPQQLVLGGIYHLVLDFNTEKSVHETGNGKYMLKPVVSGYLQNTVGSIAGTILPITGAYYVEASNATDTAGTYINATNGQFLLSTVRPGTFTVKFSPNSGFTEKIVPGIVVVAGQSTQMGTVTIQ
jgi:hypothetical protein